jgi:hypothetical protein
MVDVGVNYCTDLRGASPGCGPHGVYDDLDGRLPTHSRYQAILHR